MNMRSTSRQLNSHVDVAGTGFTVLDRIYADGDLAGEALGGSCGNVLVFTSHAPQERGASAGAWERC